jgi:hypothetical protein
LSTPEQSREDGIFFGFFSRSDLGTSCRFEEIRWLSTFEDGNAENGGAQDGKPLKYGFPASLGCDAAVDWEGHCEGCGDGGCLDWDTAAGAGSCFERDFRSLLMGDLELLLSDAAALFLFLLELKKLRSINCSS